jgi:hypothetical protein
LGLLAILSALNSARAAGLPSASYFDPVNDWLLRRTDPGACLPLDPEAHRAIDLLEITLQRWTPLDPVNDLFTGEPSLDGLFVRLDVRWAGLVNPPGPLYPFDPFLYGPTPVYGFVEVDVDANPDTGGELDFPQYRYFGSAVRFGGQPNIPDMHDRFAHDASAFDEDINTPPYVDRSGEEFHLTFLGEFDSSAITELAGDGDLCFETSEVWWIHAAWFHRAHGYEPFSIAWIYQPDSTARFAHNCESDTTLLTLVFPLTNAGAAAMWSEDPEPNNFNPADQFSVHEALNDLQISALLLDDGALQPGEQLIAGWINQTPDDYLDPGDWHVNALLGTSYTQPHPSADYFVWTDVFPNPLRGDVNGNSTSNITDQAQIRAFVDTFDAQDGQVDHRVVLPDFASNFSVYDTNHDGEVDTLDELLVSLAGDSNTDEDVDLRDLAQLQLCSSNPDELDLPPCAVLDLDTDGDVDPQDWARFSVHLTGPRTKVPY